MNKELKPFIAIAPGETIKDELEERGWTQQDLSNISGISLNNINHLLNNKISVSSEIAKLLSKAFGQSANFWLNLDINYRRHLEKKSKQEIEAEA